MNKNNKPSSHPKHSLKAAMNTMSNTHQTPKTTPESAPVPAPVLIGGIGETIADYDAYILDIWGVLHDGINPYDGVLDCLLQMKAAGKEILLLSNSPNRAADVSARVLIPMGIHQGVHYDHIVTSGEATWTAMAAYKGQKAYGLWHAEKPTALVGHDIALTTDIETADFVLGSLFPAGAKAEDYQHVLDRALARGLPFICANPDKIVNIGTDLHLCAGGVADVYEAMGGTVHWYGKPYAPIYEQSLATLAVQDKSRILAIGDSLRTDVTGACGFGIDVLWNLVGIHWEELREQTPQGMIINADSLEKTLQTYKVRPSALLRGLKWTKS